MTDIWFCCNFDLVESAGVIVMWFHGLIGIVVYRSLFCAFAGLSVTFIYAPKAFSVR